MPKSSTNGLGSDLIRVVNALYLMETSLLFEEVPMSTGDKPSNPEITSATDSFMHIFCSASALSGLYCRPYPPLQWSISCCAIALCFTRGVTI